MKLKTLRWIAGGVLVAGTACSETTSVSLPSPPENVSVSAQAGGRIEVKWSARPASERIISYSVYRNGLKVGDSPLLAFVDSTAPQLETHGYSVASQSEDGVVSEPSTAVSILAPDATPPRIISSTPAEGAINVSATPVIQVRFSEPMDSASINTATFTVKDAVSGLSLAGTVSYVRATRIATWTPMPSLPSEKKIVVTVATGVKDVSGNSLSSALNYTFTVRETVPPVVIDFTPPDGSIIPIGTWPTVRFSERMGDLAGVRWIDANTQAVRATALLVDTVTNVVTVRSFSGIQSFRPYTITVDERALDLAGNPTTTLLKFTFRFGEWSLPNVTRIFPAADATDVPTSAVLFAEFDSPLFPVNDYELKFNVRVTGSSTTLGGIGVGNAFTNRYTVTPIPSLQPNTSYTAVLYHFFTDSKGVRQEKEIVWSFRTGS